MMVEDWELGVLYFKMVEQSGGDEEEAIANVKQKFFDELCGPSRETHFFVGTTLLYPSSWIVLGVFYPPRTPQSQLPID